jgi:hypothetical protein
VNHGHRRSIPLTSLVALVALVAACGSTTPSASPSPSAAPTAATSPTAAPTTAPSQTTAATATPAPTATPTEAPSPSPAAEACSIAPQTGRLPSDRMTDVTISSSPTADLVTFTFGDMSVSDPPQGVSEGSLQAAVAPYTQAGSGAEMDIDGEHVAQIRFSGMSLSNDVEELTYDGPLELTADGAAALRQVSNYDMSEGVIGWYIGYDGNGCVTLTSDATSVTIAIDHPAS